MDILSQKINSAFTLPGTFYNDPSMLDRCKSQIFMRSWQMVAEADQLKLPETAVPFYFLEGFIDEPLLITRDKKDQLFCLSNVCTHRGNILIDTPCALSGTIRCSYHGRKFDVDGKFLGMPECEGMENFPDKRDDLPRLELNKWKQFYFTAIHPAFSFDELVKEMNERVGWMPIEKFIFDANRSQEYLVKANWALYCDNYLEGFHIPFVHKDLAKSLDYSSYASEIYKYANLQLGIARPGEVCFDLPKDSPDYGKNIAAYYFWLYPNLMFNFYPWGLSVNIIQPIKHNLTKVIFKSYVWDEGKIDQGAGALLDRVEREDEAIVEKVQKGTNSLLYDRGRYSPKMEQGVFHFHQLINKSLEQK